MYRDPDTQRFYRYYSSDMRIGKAMVGNKEVDGYGTACLQPDGSWRYGPVQTGAY